MTEGILAGFRLIEDTGNLLTNFPARGWLAYEQLSVAMGELAAIGLLATDRHRSQTGEGELIRLALSDVAFAMVGHLGRIAEAQLGARDQPKDGNYVYGAFGHDFITADERRVMVVALTARQWRALVTTTGTGEAYAAIESATGNDFETETGRYLAPRSPVDFARLGRLPVQRAPVLGEHTEQILSERLGLSEREIGGLHDRAVVAGPSARG